MFWLPGCFMQTLKIEVVKLMTRPYRGRRVVVPMTTYEAVEDIGCSHWKIQLLDGTGAAAKVPAFEVTSEEFARHIRDKTIRVAVVSLAPSTSETSSADPWQRRWWPIGWGSTKRA